METSWGIGLMVSKSLVSILKNCSCDCIKAMERLTGKDSDMELVLDIDGQEINANPLSISIKKKGL